VAISDSFAYVATDNMGLYIFQYYGGGGVEETPNPGVRMPNLSSTVVRGVLLLPEAMCEKREARGELLDISGRGVLNLKPGANDVSRLAPGVYFVRSAASGERSAVAVRKVILQR
jgi:hypothetical protein